MLYHDLLKGAVRHIGRVKCGSDATEMFSFVLVDMRCLSHKSLMIRARSGCTDTCARAHTHIHDRVEL